jgi:hypothetical protein
VTIDTAGLGSPVTDLDDYVASRPHPPCGPDRSPPPGPDPVHPGPARFRWVLVPLAVLVLAGTFALGRSNTPRDPGRAVPGATITPTSPHGLDGFAELYVATYLTASGSERTMRLERFGPGLDATGDPGANRRYVTRAATIGAESIGPGYWSVLVAADVLYHSDGGFAPGGIEHYEVAVAAVDGGFLATAPPLPVAAPATPMPVGTIGDLEGTADDATVAFMAAFVEAYFIGEGRLLRLIAPGADIDPPLPAATAVRMGAVTRGEIDGETWATAVVAVTDAEGHTLPTGITARLVADVAGAMRVAEVLPGPPPLPPSP